METAAIKALRITEDSRLAEEWELVLLAQRLNPILHRSPNGIILAVPDAEFSRALASLAAYDAENRRKNPALSVRAPTDSSWFAGVTIALLLLLFFSITTQWLATTPWVVRGGAEAHKIVGGEYWRAVTALTLHADIGHVLSNAVALATFFTAVASMAGVGVAGALVLLAGAVGNLINAHLQSSSHLAVGASTAVFGAVGLLGSLAMSHRRQHHFSPWRAWVPMAAALALLGFLGSSSGPRVDIWAHLFGFLSGSVMGFSLSRWLPYTLNPGVQWACGVGGVAIIVGSWIIAFL